MRRGSGRGVSEMVVSVLFEGGDQLSNWHSHSAYLQQEALSVTSFHSVVPTHPIRIPRPLCYLASILKASCCWSCILACVLVCMFVIEGSKKNNHGARGLMFDLSSWHAWEGRRTGPSTDVGANGS